MQVLLEGVHVAVRPVQLVEHLVQHELVVLLHQQAALEHLFTLPRQLRGTKSVTARTPSASPSSAPPPPKALPRSPSPYQFRLCNYLSCLN